jgi:serpin B
MRGKALIAALVLPVIFAMAGNVMAVQDDAADMINRFAMDLYAKNANTGRNLLFSPYGVISSMAMVYEGAKGRTADEIREALHFPADTGKLKNELSGMRDAVQKKERSYDLTIAGALWTNVKYQLKNDFSDTARKDYFGEAASLDFTGDSENSRAAINSWFENITGRRAKEPVPEGMLGSRTKLVLTSAACLKAQWQHKFDFKKTTTEYFTAASGAKIPVAMMHAKINAFLDEDSWPGVSVLELPFSGSELSMLIFLPGGADNGAFEKYLTAENLAAWRETTGYTKRRREPVDLSLPKFRIDCRQLLGGSLSDMGMPSAFTNADLSGMTADGGLQISQAIQQSYLEVNEDGTDDAVSKASVLISFNNISMVIGKPAEFRADRPFVFIIQDNYTGGIVFMGKVLDPSDGV